MNQESLDKLNTFGLGRWIFVPSFLECPQQYENNCIFLCDLFKNTDVCLKDKKHTSRYLKNDSFFVFVDNNNKPQIVGNMAMGYMLQSLRGVMDGEEQNINLKFVKVANEFIDKNLHLKNAKSWKKQINWIVRLKMYNYLFANKKYSQINVEKLIDDLGYNGFSLHDSQIEAGHEENSSYPKIKKKILSQPMLKPIVAKHLGCRTNELVTGKYYGNGKNIKYVVGDLLSPYLHESCKIKKVFGSVNIKNYEGNFKGVLDISSTYNFSVESSKCNMVIDVNCLIKDAVPLENEK